jgi:hypothetical protein
MAVAIIDWQNLRTSLACGGVTAGPGWILEALEEALREVGAQHGHRLTRIELHVDSDFESRADRYLLERGPINTPVSLRLAVKGRSAVESSVAKGVARAWYAEGHAIILVSSDSAIAHLAAEYAREATEPGRVLLLHRRPRAARAPDAAPGIIAEPLDLDVGQGLTPRPWTAWDEAAWRLHRLARPIGDRVATALLRESSRLLRRERWAGTMDLQIDWRNLEQVDDVLAALWRLGEGKSLDRDEAEEETLQRLGEVDRADVHAVIDALLVAQLLRHEPQHRLVVPSSWREGLLLPIRRIVLRLARREDHTDKLGNLIRQHRSRFYSRHGVHGPGRPEQPDQLQFHSSGDSWGWVRYALRYRLHAVEQETVRRPLGGKAVTSWRMLETPFTVRTVHLAHRIRAQVDRAGHTGRLEAVLASRGIVEHPKRWLRCLRDTGLVIYEDGRWRNTDADLRGFDP